MRSPREREVLARRAEDVELLRRSSQYLSSWFAEPMLTTTIDPAGIGHALDLGVARRGAHDAEQRRFPAQAFFDRLRHQAAVGAERVELVGVREQAERAGCSTSGRSSPRPPGSSRRRNEQISSSVEALAFELGLREHGDDVVGRVLRGARR